MTAVNPTPARLSLMRALAAAARPTCGWAVANAPHSGDLIPVAVRYPKVGIDNPRPPWTSAPICAGHIDEARRQMSSNGMSFRVEAPELGKEVVYQRRWGKDPDEGMRWLAEAEKRRAR